ncbi:hypothetical protein GA0070614_0469 [Micromonospora coxensis]|uniref:Uncharacterized protein n=1 Tax=Micromonospora coxensis TaxID=356852 RepID=A0A1C5GWB2_9ACTN|nr:hypothetical protein GA0070614_0469 [Micromonospora coxensis]
MPALRQPAHYGARLADYHHDTPTAPDCFLIQHRD